MKTKTALPFTTYQKLLVGFLAFLQFSIILDFMILSPLGAILMPALKIGPTEFGKVVSAYAFSAGASGILAAGFADRYDRKKLLLFFYAGFILGTLYCGLASDYKHLMLARIITGIFGGVIGSIVLAIVTDLFEMNLRGRVMGYIQAAFAGSQILGIPLGLFLANHWGWHFPFYMIVVVSSLVWFAILYFMKPVSEHLTIKSDRNPFHHLLMTIKNPRYILGFMTVVLLTTGGFMIMPFSSAFSVNNLGIHIEELPYVYLASGFTSMICGPLMGRACDTYGKYKVFLFGTVISGFMVLIYTHLKITPLWLVVFITSVMFIGITSRIISSQAMMSGIPTAADRGAFMAINSSFQQISGGLASVLAGMIVVQRPDGILEHFDRIGYVVTLALIFTLFMMGKINKIIHNKE